MSDTSVRSLSTGGATEDIPPQPLPDPDSRGFWEATGRGELAICRCASCRLWMHPPLERCRACGGPTAFETTSGRGRIHSFIVTHRASVPGMGAGPHVIVLADLDDAPGVRLTGTLADVDPVDVKIGLRISTRIVPVTGGPFRIPEFVIEPSEP